MTENNSKPRIKWLKGFSDMFMFLIWPSILNVDLIERNDQTLVSAFPLVFLPFL